MTSFTFLSPLYLVGLASALIPLLIHLSRSRRTKKMRFSTTRFFTDQFLRSYHMSKLKELVLLACRMALCALLAMAVTLWAGPGLARAHLTCITKKVLIPDTPSGSTSSNTEENLAFWIDEAAKAIVFADGAPADAEGCRKIGLADARLLVGARCRLHQHA